MTGGHTAVRRGKRVLVVMKDGNHFVAKFKDRKSRHIEFLDHDPVEKSEVRGISPYKEVP